MRPSGLSDEALLAGRDAAGFEEFYVRHVEGLLGFFAGRTRDSELAADLTAETFAAALASPARYRPASPLALRLGDMRARHIKQHTTKEQPPWVPSKSPAF